MLESAIGPSPRKRILDEESRDLSGAQTASQEQAKTEELLLLRGRLGLRPCRRRDRARRRGRFLGLIGGGRRGVALAGLHHTQACDVAQVLLVGLGKDVAAGAVGDEVELA